MPKIVRVTVEGGLVQYVEVPKGVTVIVKDYDVEGVEQEWLTKDDEGNYYVESTWTPEK